MLSCVVWSQSPARRSKMVKSPGHFVMGQLWAVCTAHPHLHEGSVASPILNMC